MPAHCSDVAPPKEPSPADDLTESWLPTWRRPDGALWVDFGMPCPICNETMAPFPDHALLGVPAWLYKCRTPRCVEIMSGVACADEKKPERTPPKPSGSPPVRKCFATVDGRVCNNPLGSRWTLINNQWTPTYDECTRRHDQR